MSLDSLWQKLCEHVGLSEYEAKVYISLIMEGPSTARRLSMVSGVPRTKIYGTLKKLIERGLVVEIPDTPRRFISVSPSEVFTPFLKLYESKVEDLYSLLSSLNRIYSRMEGMIRMRKGEIWTLIGRREILKRISEMLSRAESFVDIVTTENGLILVYKAYNKILDALIDKGVEIRIITQRGSKNQHIIRELRYICKIKHRSIKSPVLFVNVDNREFLLAGLSPDDYNINSGKDIGMFVKNPLLCALMSTLFRIERAPIHIYLNYEIGAKSKPK